MSVCGECGAETPQGIELCSECANARASHAPESMPASSSAPATPRRRGETVGTLRAYFLLAGALNVVAALWSFTRSTDAAGIVTAVGALVVGGAFVYLGARLETLLKTSARLVRQMLFGVGAVLALETVFAYVSGGPIAAVRGLFWLAIVWYLLSNTGRLAAGAAAE